MLQKEHVERKQSVCRNFRELAKEFNQGSLKDLAFFRFTRDF